MLPVSSALFLLGLAIILIPPTLHLTSTVQGSNRTISLIGNYYDWNYSQPSGANPPITVAEGDTVIIKLTSTDTTHQFALDVDRDGPMFIASCPRSDTCSAMFTPSTPTSISITVSFPPGTYKYFYLQVLLHLPFNNGRRLCRTSSTDSGFFCHIQSELPQHPTGLIGKLNTHRDKPERFQRHSQRICLRLSPRT